MTAVTQMTRGPWAAMEASAPKALESGVTVAMLIAVTTIGVAIAVYLLRVHRGRTMLRNRVTFDLLPTTSFDPSPEDVVRFANQLTRVRPAASRLAPRRAAVVRVQLTTGADGLLQFRLTGPANAASVLGHQGYAQVELKRAEPTPEPVATAADQGERR